VVIFTLRPRLPRSKSSCYTLISVVLRRSEPFGKGKICSCRESITVRRWPACRMLLIPAPDVQVGLCNSTEQSPSAKLKFFC
jgi:hypothetical protein